MEDFAVRPLRLALAALLASIVGACATSPPPLPPLPGNQPHGQALWNIVHGRCVPALKAGGPPAPCTLVDIAGGEDHGYAVLKDLVGPAQHLVMPTVLIPGVEDPRLLAPDARNYFAEAWAARRFVEAKLGHAVPRDQISISVNSQYGRSQDLLHLHVDCLPLKTRDAIAAAGAQAGRGFSNPVMIDGHAYRIRRIEGEALSANPFHLLAREVPGARAQMAGWTLVLAGADFGGRPGFWLLAGRADPAHGDYGSGELLQGDHRCTDQNPPSAG